MTLIHEPKQQRSMATQIRILEALERLLMHRFFEQITIRDIAEEAGVSPGTLYRRFRDKNALLPILYTRYDERLRAWASKIWSEESLRKNNSVRSRIRHLIQEHVTFYRENTGVLRTVYLYLRLHPELDVDLETMDHSRVTSYTDLFQPVFEALADVTLPPTNEERFKLSILIMITTINERVLFPELRPARILQLDEATFVERLTDVIANTLLTQA